MRSRWKTDLNWLLIGVQLCGVWNFLPKKQSFMVNAFKYIEKIVTEKQDAHTDYVDINWMSNLEHHRV